VSARSFFPQVLEDQLRVEERRDEEVSSSESREEYVGDSEMEYEDESGPGIHGRRVDCEVDEYLFGEWGEEEVLENGFERNRDEGEDETDLDFMRLKGMFCDDDCERKGLDKWCERVFNRK